MSHPTADAIYSEMRKEIPNISLSMVYRNLRLLTEEGEINELELVGNLSRFDGVTRPDYHFRYEKCGRVFDLDEKVNDAFNRGLPKRWAYRNTKIIFAKTFELSLA